MRTRLSALGAAGALMLALAAPASAHVTITDFRLSPSCVQPGGSVNWSVTIKQDHWYHVHRVYSRTLVRNAQTGVVLSRQDNGPEYVPYGTHSRSGTAVVPANAPTGDYSVTLLLGSTQGGSEWGSATRPLKVRALAVLC